MNKLLAYIGFYRNRSHMDMLRRIVLSSFTPSNISEAKTILTASFSTKLDSCAFLGDRRSSSTRAAHEAMLDDIFGMLDLLDTNEHLSKTTFVAANLELLPKVGPEDLNLAEIADRQSRMETTIKEVVYTVGQCYLHQRQRQLTWA